jgi:hypothetical protein
VYGSRGDLDKEQGLISGARLGVTQPRSLTNLSGGFRTSI